MPLYFRAQQPLLLHSMQQRIQRPWAKTIAVSAQFANHPETKDRFFAGVMEDV